MYIYTSTYMHVRMHACIRCGWCVHFPLPHCCCCSWFPVSPSLSLSGVLWLVSSLSRPLPYSSSTSPWFVLPRLLVYPRLRLATSTTVIPCLCVRVHSAVELYNEMLETDGMVPDVYTYSSLISAHARLGNVEEAVKILSDMAKSGVKPNRFTLSSVMQVWVCACVRACACLHPYSCQSCLSVLGLLCLLSVCTSFNRYSHATRFFLVRNAQQCRFLRKHKKERFLWGVLYSVCCSSVRLRVYIYI